LIVYTLKCHKIQENYRDIKIITYEINEKLLQDLPLSNHASLANYYRLLIAQILPKNIDKILYLDSDTVIINSIQDLYDLEINQSYLAALGSKTAVGQSRRLQLKSQGYFNTGVMLINLKRWRENNIGECALKFAKHNPSMMKWWDQDALNKIIDGEFYTLDKKWNYTIDLSVPPKNNSNINNTNINPVIIHFVGALKPWYLWCFDSRKEIYWLYLKQSLWSSALPQYPRTYKQFLSALKNIWLATKNKLILNK
jgi:lipopolysaccharide biosynthesis glycosyltransferase